jgi:LL-H family phage holin
MSEGLMNIILACIPVLGAIITYFVVPFIQASVSEKQLLQYKQWCDLAVRCAEMVIQESGRGEDKKEYVVRFLNDLFNKNKIVITKDQLEILIEACVKEMKENESKNVN